jgi:hypothetical protein
MYLRDRIQNQRSWYGSKSDDHVRRARWWLIAIALTQCLGAIGAIVLVAHPESRFNWASVLASSAAAFVAWLQVNQHQELGHTYSIAAHELGLVEARGHDVSTEDAFNAFVGDAEAAISREHMMWVAKRDVVT